MGKKSINGRIRIPIYVKEIMSKSRTGKMQSRSIYNELVSNYKVKSMGLTVGTVTNVLKKYPDLFYYDKKTKEWEYIGEE